MDNLAEAGIAFLKLGLPVTILSCLGMWRLFNSGELDASDNRKAIEKRLSEIRKTDRQDKGVLGNLFETKWMQFGGGFYGLAGLWTFVVIELEQLLDFVLNFPGFEHLLQQGIGQLFVQFFVGQLQNFIAAIVWFTYWADGGAAIGIWMLVAYVSFLTGHIGS